VGLTGGTRQADGRSSDQRGGGGVRTWQPKTPEQPDNELQNELQLEY
jgi:hypothetical protein